MDEIDIDDVKFNGIIEKMKSVEKYFNPDGTINATEIVRRNNIFINAYEKAISNISIGLRVEMTTYSLFTLANSVLFGYTFQTASFTWGGIAWLAGFGICATLMFFKVISTYEKYGYVIAERDKIKEFREQNNEKRIIEVWEMLKNKGT